MLKPVSMVALMEEMGEVVVLEKVSAVQLHERLLCRDRYTESRSKHSPVARTHSPLAVWTDLPNAARRPTTEEAECPWVGLPASPTLDHILIITATSVAPGNEAIPSLMGSRP